jgi:hypothetical protein
LPQGLITAIIVRMPVPRPEETAMSKTTAFHLSAGMCFVIALVFYVMGFSAKGEAWMIVPLVAGAAFEGLALLRLIEQPKELPNELS